MGHTRRAASGRALGLLGVALGLLFGLSACDRPSVTAEPSAPAPAAPATPAPTTPAPAPTTTVPTAPAANAAPSSAPAAAKLPKPAPAKPAKKPGANLTDDEMCEGAAQEGCIPKDDPHGFVARE